MKIIGIRELRDGLSRHIARVRAGGTITVTDHGAPVARIIPVDAPTAPERLISEGVVEPPVHPRRPAPDPVIADVALSQLVIDDRR